MKTTHTHIHIDFKYTCPYCKTREIKKKTCGDPVCQLRHHQATMIHWWKTKGKVYNGRRK